MATVLTPRVENSERDALEKNHDGNRIERFVCTHHYDTAEKNIFRK